MINPPTKTIARESSMHYAIIIPACDEESCLKTVLDELRSVDNDQFQIVVGVNGSSDRTTEIAQKSGVMVAETRARGYGHGCQAAVELVQKEGIPIDAFIFFAGDGANDPAEIASLIAAHQKGNDMVLGCRTNLRSNMEVMGLSHMLASRFLGFWCGCLTGRFFRDIGPLRLIDRRLFNAMQLHEWVYGWTIEAQIKAVLLCAKTCEIPVSERKRISGMQKVSRVTWKHSLKVGMEILMAGWRTRFPKVSSVSVAIPKPCDGAAGGERV